MLSTYNVFEAARLLGLQRVVWASSETILGLPFEREQPAYAPIDEDHPPRPESSYALSKLLAEELGRQLHRWSGTPYVALRFSNIIEPEEYGRFPSLWGDASLRPRCEPAALEPVGLRRRPRRRPELPARTRSRRGRGALHHRRRGYRDEPPERELMAEVFPSVPYRPTAGSFDTLLSIEKARTLLGYEPQWSWRDHIADRPD